MGLAYQDLLPTKQEQNQKKRSSRRFKVGGIGFDAEGAKYLIIKLPNSRISKVLARCFVLALLILSFPWLKTVGKTKVASYQSIPDSEVGNGNSIGSTINGPKMMMLPVLFHDLVNEGLLKAGNKAVFLTGTVTERNTIEASEIVPTGNDMEYVPMKDLKRQISVLDNTVDFVFTFSFPSSMEFIDRTLKVGGIAVTYLNGPPPMFDLPSNYKIVYFRKLKEPAIALRKTDLTQAADSWFSPMQRRLCGFGPELKKAVLKNLEDVLLEPPRAASGRSRTYLKRTKYLPDLLGVSLESYPRRVFINVGSPEKEGEDSTAVWFTKHYPNRNLDFDMYKIETESEDPSSTTMTTKEHTDVEMSEWLMKNVKEGEYVVMKANAEVMEEMVKSKEAVRLVDELFLECKPRGSAKVINRSRRAYWECLSLYGRLRDEGVAVHQWWG